MNFSEKTQSKVHSRLDQTLVAMGLMDHSAVERVNNAISRTDERFDIVATRLGLVSEADMTKAIAANLDMPLAAASDFPVEPVLPDVLNARFVRNGKILPLEIRNDTLRVATTDPFNHDALATAGYAADLKIECWIAFPADFERALESLYSPSDGETSQAEETFSGGLGEAGEDDVQRLRDIASEAPNIRLVNQLIASAIEQKASDIHIEPLEGSVVARFRIDGFLQTVRQFPKSSQAAIISRIKIMAKLDIAERRLPQDGRIKITDRGRTIDLRVSTAPTVHGESTVLRILDRGQIQLEFGALGFSDDVVKRLKTLQQHPNGIILVTGPTGSGKTTTLYTSLRELGRSDQKVFTVEDPVEYLLRGVNQIQVQPAIGLTFAHALRSILRQDPDVIMIGEIRDLETAQIAIQASLTGHLVLATLHTNSAASSLTRLLDMGVDDYLLASTVSGILAQRLVRVLCDDCAQPDQPTASLSDRLQAVCATHGPSAQSGLRKAAGCDNCNQTGYAGRTTLSELLLMDDKIRACIMEGAGERRIEDQARKAGMQTMFEDGLQKVATGRTTIDEVMRVTRFE